MSAAPEILLLALLLDAALGEPAWLWSRLPHPAVLMGRAIGWADRRFNRGGQRRLRGALALAGLTSVAIALGWAIQALLPGRLADIVLVAILLAQRSLVEHVAAVAAGLRQSLEAGRRAVSMIVGRDTDGMDEPAVARAAIESAAENLSDGVVAPAVWFLVGGLPGVLAYKLVNTADSMIGHRTPRHEAFGWAAARLDDVMNWIPARLTGALILLSHGEPRGWAAVAREARQHRSPNAGWPEAAMARCLDTALSGPRSYDGAQRDFPYIHPTGDRFPDARSVDRAVTALWRSWVGLALATGLILLLS
ncbi:adenosylcobinamide-phosphate synthase CbiB [Tropicimonas sp. IMCC6043]|uniref:adenosylcobinamide-phosphate synthase CbiB n=1 Tax=Tropicimonas sp. IMCC6043 TaxID=2510645 RepID=UPI00101B6792|nr:adenosylcobinamide-phosphate synthase CbiB [Tropicimonas sp. IMCC6043]RYH11789.1 cobalamin biosynthesis protein [Tropicimonas sp. IMCC6043]